ncbi:MAG: tRNA lysidine(34) synthetase TilS [Bacteroidetes bacterium]|nr:tRNA lysidine(34) synthetase TilS [Bacteroidota bacterium]
MLNLLTSYIQKEKLFSKSDKILITVSGGIDSVVLCELFRKAKFNFGIAHCNFKLRQKESDEDEQFAEALAEKLNVPFHTINFNTSTFAKKNKLSVQVAARQLRYEWFEQISEQFKYKYIATAHHADDSAETFFINLLRGTGIAGLHGILPKQGKIIRPLLFATKNDIIEFAKENKIKYREDSSNASDKYLRNKIRHHLIPALKDINPNFQSTIAESINHLREVESIYRKSINKKRKSILKEKDGKILISISELNKAKPPAPYLFEYLNPFGFNSSAIENILKSLDQSSGKQFFSGTHRLVKDRDLLIIDTRIKKPEAGKEKTKNHFIKKNQKELIVDGMKLNFKSFAKTSSYNLNTNNTAANIDFDKLKFPLEIRTWQKGDVFYPLGMKGKKKLSDLFTDKKLSLDKKEQVQILTSAGKIVWVIGIRMDERFKVAADTKKIYFAEQV